MRILSLFDGISCGKVALERAGAQIDEYIAYEIDPDAITVSMDNHPEIKHCGDVTKADFTQYKGIDLLIGGSPCQGFSSSGKGLNFEDPRSRLFFEYVRAIKEAQPTYFLLENVVMRKEWQDVITEYLGVAPVMINSSLVSAQNRKRLYWTNIPGVGQPEDKGIRLQDVLEDIPFEGSQQDGGTLHKATIVGRRINAKGHREDYNREIPITQCLEVRKTNIEKSCCLTTVDKDNVITPLPAGRYIDAFTKFDSPCEEVGGLGRMSGTDHCLICGAVVPEGMQVCTACMKHYEVEAGDAGEMAEQLRDIADVLKITEATDGNIRQSMQGILNIADRLERKKSKWQEKKAENHNTCQ